MPGSATGAMARLHPQITRRCAIGTKFISDERLGCEAIFLKELTHEFQRGILVSLRLYKHLASGVESAPEVHLGPVDLQEDPVEMPGRVRLWPTPAQIRSDQWPKMIHPAPNRLVGNRNAAFGQQVFDVA